MAVTGLRSWLATLVTEFAKIPHYHSEGERLLRAMRTDKRVTQRGARRVYVVGRLPDRKQNRHSVALGIWPVAVVSIVLLASAKVEAAVPLGVVRTLAEDVLGAGSVTSIRILDDGDQVLIRWDSPTYKSSTPISATREQIFAEAQLVTGSVMGQLDQIKRMRFTIVRENKMLATGENARGRGVVMMFSSEMGGGIMRPTNPKYDPNRPQGGEAAKEL